MAYPIQNYDENYVLPMSAGMAIVGEYRDFDDDRDISPAMVKLVQEVVSEMQNRSFPAIFYCFIGEILKFGESDAAMTLMKRVVMAMDGDGDFQKQTCPECGSPIIASFDKEEDREAYPDNEGILYFECVYKHGDKYGTKEDIYCDDHFLAEYVVRKNGKIEHVDQDMLF